jgi:hypothetical protein
MRQPQGFNPTFENGGFWEYYKDLERQFEDFLEYVPYIEGNEKTYSFKLLNIFLSICGHIDSAFKELARYPRFAEIESCQEILRRAEARQGIIVSGISAFDEIYAIISMTVTFKCLPNRISITPFNCEHPEWWNSYNDLKHDLAVNLKKANLETVRDALAGAFLLNVIHEPAALRLFDFGLLKPNYAQGTTFFEPIFDTFRGRKPQDRPPDCKPVEDAFTIETSLFSFDYEEAKKLLESQGKYRIHEPKEPDAKTEGESK